MIILILIFAAAAGWGGWKIATWLNKKKNEVNTQTTTYLKDFIEELKHTNQYWKDQSSYNKNIQDETIANHNKNIHHTLDTLLNLLQKQNNDTLKSEDKEKIESIINRTKSILHK